MSGNAVLSVKMGGHVYLISLLVGEMPGRAEGGILAPTFMSGCQSPIRTQKWPRLHGASHSDGEKRFAQSSPS
jgi:hypothetical protein